MKDRKTNRVVALVVSETSQRRLQTFVHCNAALHKRAKVYTDDPHTHPTSGFPIGPPNHSSVKHRRRSYVRGEVHTNGIEWFWSMLKRGYYGTYHWMSRKHLLEQTERVCREGIQLRPLGTIGRIASDSHRQIVVSGIEATRPKRLRYCRLGHTEAGQRRTYV